MGKLLTPQQIEAYRRDGYAAPLRVMSEDEALALRARLEEAEAAAGGPLQGQLRFKPHLIFTFLDDLVRNDRLLDGVEDVLGPDLLCWASSFFTKEARDPGYVTWHQDSTYWGLSDPDVTTAWVALSESTRANGCMRVIPGSHTRDQIGHTDTHAEANMLSRGQVVNCKVDESEAVDLVLRPGEMSLHHVRLIHGSEPNATDDRRIGFAIRYIPTWVRQTNGPRDSAVLVRGADAFGNFEKEPPPEADLHPAALEAHRRSADLHGQLLYRGTDRQAFS